MHRTPNTMIRHSRSVLQNAISPFLTMTLPTTMPASEAPYTRECKSAAVSIFGTTCTLPVDAAASAGPGVDASPILSAISFGNTMPGTAFFTSDQNTWYKPCIA